MTKIEENNQKKPSRNKGFKEKKSKEDKLYDNLLKVIQQFICGKSYLPLSETDLMERLALPPQHQTTLKQVLKELTRTKIVELKKGRYSFKASSADLVVGVIKVHPRGFGFLQPSEPGYAQDIFVPKHLTQNAVDGDTVEVLVNPEVSEKGPEGRVVAILSRARTHLAGVIKEIEPYGQITAYVPLLGFSQRVVVLPQSDEPIKVGDRIVMEVKDWGSKETETVCKFSHHIGHISDASCDIKAAIEEFELRSDFSHKTIEEAKKLGNKIPQSEIAKREDLRTSIECFTIDPDTAKDFDDAISLTKDEKGHYHLGVHIADVSHYVRPGTALDKEAVERCNSTYFPGYCLPMLPSVLSDNLCSLKPRVNRLTVSIFIDFDEFGHETGYRISRSVIKSANRFTYKEAKAVIDKKKKSKYAPTLNLMVELCGLLKKRRYERGSIEFALPELVVMVDEQGIPYKTDYITYDITHQLVEEFMLKANETVALHLNKIGKNLTYRVHDEPAEENMKDFSTLANAFGFNLSEKPQPAELQKLFDEALHTPYGEYLATSYIRRMRLAIYSADNIGHFGLGLSHYCHFTSPIRRYVDLVVHRILFGEKDDRETLEQISASCSEQERISAKAEQNVVLLKKLRLLKAMYEENPQRQYEAVVTKVKNFGISFEILELMLESFLHVSELHEDYYLYEEGNSTLRGRRTGHVYRSGDKITVMLKNVDLISLESLWNLVSIDKFVKENHHSQNSEERSEEDRSHRHSRRRSQKNRGRDYKNREHKERQKDQEHKVPHDDKEQKDQHGKELITRDKEFKSQPSRPADFIKEKVSKTNRQPFSSRGNLLDLVKKSSQPKSGPKKEHSSKKKK